MSRTRASARKAGTAHVTWWRCRPDWLIPPATCDAQGNYIDTFTTGASGPANAHTRDTGHPTEAGAGYWIKEAAA